MKRDGTYAKHPLFEMFPCMLLVLLCLCFALRRPTKSHFSVSSQRGSSNLQYTNTWLNQCPLLKAHETIAEQVSFRLPNGASAKRRSSSPVTYLEIPEVLAQILTTISLSGTRCFPSRWPARPFRSFSRSASCRASRACFWAHPQPRRDQNGAF